MQPCLARNSVPWKTKVRVLSLLWAINLHFVTAEFARQFFPFFDAPFLRELEDHTTRVTLGAGQEILREQQYVKVLPVVIRGLVKVYSRFQEKELLLYYIEPAQSCVMTFYAGLNQTPSKIFAQTESEVELLLIPVSLLPRWVKEYPEFNTLFYHQYNLRYAELLDTIGHLLIDKMDKRLFEHLQKKWELTGKQPIRMSHGQIASELGTSREVVTRVLKKLEIDGKVRQEKEGIWVTGIW